MSEPAPYAHVVQQLGRDHPLLALALQHHRTTRGGALQFRDRPYLVELYKDFHKLDGADVVKAVQTGFSELLLQFAFERAGWRARTVAYVLPTSGLRDRFVHARVDPLLLTVPAYRARSPGEPDGEKDGATSVRLKRFGAGLLMFMGSNTPREFVEFSADALIVDEYDHCDRGHLALADDRLRESPHPQRFRVGNPTAPRSGISALFDDGDGRRWKQRCPACGHRQALDWFVHLVRQRDDGSWELRDRERTDDGTGDPRPVCARCDQPFDRSGDGACWVAERPGRWRTYTMSRLDVLSERIRRLFSEWVAAQGSTARVQAFHRSVLGRAYEHAEARVSVEVLGRAASGMPIDPIGGPAYAELGAVAGIDVGALLNVEVAVTGRDAHGVRVRRVAWAGTVRTFEEARSILDRYHVRCCVVDARPETRKAQELRDAMRGTCAVWLCQFHPTDRVGAEDYGMRLDHRSRVVTVDRTQILDATLDDLRSGRCVLPANILSVDGYADQMGAPARVLDPERERYVWREGNAPDHYRFADAYCRVAADIHSRGGRYEVLETRPMRLVDPEGEVVPQ